jgi:ribosomal protein S18 acetylase RimI-like enzyme
VSAGRLRVAKKIAFDDLQAHRFWLDVRSNTRAKALYDSEGFSSRANCARL